MTKLYVTEYGQIDTHGIPEEPAVATQVVDYTAAEAKSSAFNRATQYVTIRNDSICSVAFGTAPTADTSSPRLAAGSTVTVKVPKGKSYKVSAITNT